MRSRGPCPRRDGPAVPRPGRTGRRRPAVPIRGANRQQVLEQVRHDQRLRKHGATELRVAGDRPERSAHQAVPVPHHPCHRCSLNPVGERTPLNPLIIRRANEVIISGRRKLSCGYATHCFPADDAPPAGPLTLHGLTFRGPDHGASIHLRCRSPRLPGGSDDQRPTSPRRSRTSTRAPHLRLRAGARAGRRARPATGGSAASRSGCSGRHRRQLAQERARRRGGGQSACRSSSTRNAAAFAALAEPLTLSVDDFIRTSSDPRHRRRRRAALAGLRRGGDLYRGTTRACTASAASSSTPTDELTGRALPGARHGAAAGRRGELVLPPVPLRRPAARPRSTIGAAADRARRAAQRGARASSTAGCADFSVSRVAPNAPAAGASRCPGDPGQVIYVWWDALGNYLTASDYGDRRRQPAPVVDRRRPARSTCSARACCGSTRSTGRRCCCRPGCRCPTESARPRLPHGRRPRRSASRPGTRVDP